MQIQIKHRYDGSILHEGDYNSIADAVTAAIKAGADLTSANLRYANLTGADLTGADLRCANLTSANLTSADLTSANLRYADLTSADLTSADLRCANLTSANLTSANLTSANLTYADLTGADLARAKNAELVIARTRILPEGDLIGWKKCRNDVIVKLRIPADAKRSHAWGRKCRAEFADVIEVFGAEFGVSNRSLRTKYVPGKRVMPDRFDEDWRNECAPGIHFYLSRIEAEAHQF